MSFPLKRSSFLEFVDEIDTRSSWVTFVSGWQKFGPAEYFSESQSFANWVDP